MERKKLDIYVGLFVLIGLAVCAWLIIEFGKVGQTFQKSYQLYAKFDNGHGLLNGSQIRYTGTLVGRVTKSPRLMTDSIGNQYVQVEMSISDDIKILKGSRFTIGQFGFLGDNFIDITPPTLKEGQAIEYIPYGDTIKGSQPVDFSALTIEGADVMQQLKKISLQLETTTSNINLILTPETAKNINQTIANAKDISGNMKTFSAKLNNAQGPIAEILNDKQSAVNLSAFIYNLRKKGVLFYSDVYDEENKTIPVPVKNKK